MSDIASIYLITVIASMIGLGLVVVMLILPIYVRKETNEETIPDDWWSGGFADNH